MSNDENALKCSAC